MTPALHSKLLTRAEVDRFLRAARASRFFKPGTDDGGRVSLIRPQIPDLEGYDFEPRVDISLTHETRNVKGFVDRSFAVWRDCAPHAISILSFLHVAESGRPFDPAEDADVVVSYGSDRDGDSVLSLRTGSISPGSADLAYRQRLFSGAIEVLGLAGDLEVFVRDGRLKLETKTDRIIFPSVDPVRPPHNHPRDAYNLVLLNLVGQNGENFREVCFYTFPPTELRAKVEALLKHLGSEKQVAAEISFQCQPPSFPAIRERLNASELSPWEVSCYVQSGYTVDDLDRALGEHDSFRIHGLELNVPKVATADGDLYYDKNSGFRLSFYFYGRQAISDKKWARMRDVITELAGDPDFLLPDEIL